MTQSVWPSLSTAHARSRARDVGVRLLGAVRAVVTSEIGGRFQLMFGAIVALLVGISGLNVLSSYVGRDLMTAIERRSAASFLNNAILSVGMFAALTGAAVVLRFIEERLALMWREWLTRGLIAQYLGGGVYLRLRERGELGNPDQRIADDARAFTATTLSFVLMFLNALLAILAFSGVMWSISPLLFAVAVAYAALGSLFTVAMGKPLVRLNYDQSDREATFRSELVHLGENAESVALLQLEERLSARLRRHLEALVSNARRIIVVNRNLSFFTSGYAYGIQLLPPLIVGPLFMHGKVEFGVITQSAMAFSHLLGAFSLIVTQIQQLSSYAATVVRLDKLTGAMELLDASERTPRPDVDGIERLVYDDVTLHARSGELLVANLTITIRKGTRLLITGTDEARRALFRATALGPDAPEGHIARPGSERMSFLPERPHVPIGTLRELLLRAGHEHAVPDERVCQVLSHLGLEPALQRLGGLDVDGDWEHLLSLSEQQLLTVARVILAAPAFAALHSPGTTLAPDQLGRALSLLSEAQVTYVAFGGDDASPGTYDAVLELDAGGTWTLRHLG